MSGLHEKWGQKLPKPNPALTLGIAALCVIIFLTVRNWGAYATIMWDEWEYDRYARQLPLSSADIPYYLYYFTYGITKFCGDGFMACAQILNAVFFAASLPFLYLVCRRVAPQNLSLIIAILSVLGGISTYATHFMPESMYFFAFWLCSWAFLASIDLYPQQPLKLGLYAGVALAVLSLVKLHAVFLLPGMILYILACTASGLIEKNMRKAVGAACLLVTAFFTVRFSLGYLIAGSNGLSLLGPAYSNRAHSALSSGFLLHLWPFVLGHILAVIAMYSLPLLAMGTLQFGAHSQEARKRLSIQLYAWCLLLPLIGVAALYTAHVSQLNPEIEGANGLVRLHLRYYNFLFPFFAIAAAATATSTEQQDGRSWKKLCAATLMGACTLFFVLHLNAYQLSVNDGPELRGFASLHVVAYILASISVATSFLWAWNARRAAHAYLLLFFPLFTLLGGTAAYYSAHKEQTPTLYHRAGLFAKSHLGKDISEMMVVGSDFAGLYQSMLYADNPSIALKTAPEHSCLKLSPSPTGKSWLLVIGDYKFVSPIDAAFKEDGYSFFHIEPSDIEAAPCP